MYNASKSALHSFTNDPRVELAETRSRVIGIYPGMTDTDLAQKLPGGAPPKSKHAMIDPKILADYIVYTQQLPRTIEVSDIILDRKNTARNVLVSDYESWGIERINRSTKIETYYLK